MSDVRFSRASLGAAELPDYPGLGLSRITLVDSAALADEALAALMAADAIGFDTESKPTFLKGEVSTGPHLVQLATDARAYLFPITRALGTVALKAILEAPHLLKVGLGLGNDRSALKSRLGVELTNLLDLGEVLRGNDLAKRHLLAELHRRERLLILERLSVPFLAGLLVEREEALELHDAPRGAEQQAA